jgi:hypothetical protein
MSIFNILGIREDINILDPIAYSVLHDSGRESGGREGYGVTWGPPSIFERKKRISMNCC